MPQQPTIRTAESAYLVGRARWRKFLEKFMRGWMEPIQDEMAVMMWESLPEKVRDELKRQAPEQYAKAEEQIRLFKLGG